jgi:transposase
MARILAIDLGKYKSVACDLNGDEHRFRKLPTCPKKIHDLIVELEPQRVVIEVGSQAGWIQDLCQALEVPVQIANPNHEGWRWRNVKRKTDRDDALKLAKLSAAGQLPTVTLPSGPVRQWRSLIGYRSKLIGRRTAIKNSIRALLDRQGMRMPSGRRGWSTEALKQLWVISQSLREVNSNELWRGQLRMELLALEQVEALLGPVEARLDAIAKQDKRVELLRSIPGVGPRLAETVVAVIDDPKRFKTRKQVAAYAGLVPRQYESGTLSRSGGITGAGHRLLRTMLIEVGWMMKQHNPQLYAVFENTARGVKSRRKIAIVALARRLLILCWAMLRDGARWRAPAASAPS